METNKKTLSEYGAKITEQLIESGFVKFDDKEKRELFEMYMTQNVGYVTIMYLESLENQEKTMAIMERISEYISLTFHIAMNIFGDYKSIEKPGKAAEFSKVIILESVKALKKSI